MKSKSIDLFAGIGGIRLGFDQAFGEEIETVFVSERDEFSKKHNFQRYVNESGRNFTKTLLI